MSTWRVRLIVGVLVGLGTMSGSRAATIRPWEDGWATTPADLAAAVRAEARASLAALTDTVQRGLDLTRCALHVQDDPWLDVRQTGWSLRVRRFKAAQCWARSATGFDKGAARALLLQRRDAAWSSPRSSELSAARGALSPPSRQLTARLDHGRASELAGAVLLVDGPNGVFAQR